MKENHDLLNYLWMFLSGLFPATIRFLRNKVKSPSLFITEILIGVSFAFFIVPALAEHFEWSFKFSLGVTWLFTFFSNEVFKLIWEIAKSKIKSENNNETTNNNTPGDAD